MNSEKNVSKVAGNSQISYSYICMNIYVMYVSLEIIQSSIIAKPRGICKDIYFTDMNYLFKYIFIGQ